MCLLSFQLFPQIPPFSFIISPLLVSSRTVALSLLIFSLSNNCQRRILLEMSHDFSETHFYVYESSLIIFIYSRFWGIWSWHSMDGLNLIVIPQFLLWNSNYLSRPTIFSSGGIIHQNPLSSVWLRELKLGFCNSLERWERVRGGREVRGGGDICTPMANACWCREGIKPIL